MKRLVISAAIALALVLAILKLRAQSPNDDLIDITDPAAVSFSQLSFGGPVGPAGGTNAVMLFVNFQELANLGLTDTYLQVFVCLPGADPTTGTQPCDWVVENMPVLDPALLPGESAIFELPFEEPFRAISGSFEGIVLASRPKAPPVPRMPAPTPQKNHPVINLKIGKMDWNIGGLDIPPPAPINPNTIMPVFDNMTKPKVQVSKQESVQTMFNQCTPAAVANSLNFLGMTGGLMGDQPGAFGKPNTSLVGALDTYMMRPQTGCGPNMKMPCPTQTLDMLNGKMKFIADKKLNLTFNSQGMFCKPAGQNCVPGQVDVNGKPVAAPKPTAPFIMSELDKMEDVEACFSFTGPMPPATAGAHCVHVEGYKLTNGMLQLEMAHDANQMDPKKGTAPDEGGQFTVDVGKGPGGNLYFNKSGFGTAMITHVLSESPK